MKQKRNIKLVKLTASVGRFFARLIVGRKATPEQDIAITPRLGEHRRVVGQVLGRYLKELTAVGHFADAVAKELIARYIKLADVLGESVSVTFSDSRGCGKLEDYRFIFRTGAPGYRITAIGNTEKMRARISTREDTVRNIMRDMANEFMTLCSTVGYKVEGAIVDGLDNDYETFSFSLTGNGQKLISIPVTRFRGTLRHMREQLEKVQAKQSIPVTEADKPRAYGIGQDARNIAAITEGRPQVRTEAQEQTEAERLANILAEKESKRVCAQVQKQPADEKLVPEPGYGQSQIGTLLDIQGARLALVERYNKANGLGRVAIFDNQKQRFVTFTVGGAARSTYTPPEFAGLVAKYEERARVQRSNLQAEVDAYNVLLENLNGRSTPAAMRLNVEEDLKIRNRLFFFEDYDKFRVAVDEVKALLQTRDEYNAVRKALNANFTARWDADLNEFIVVFDSVQDFMSLNPEELREFTRQGREYLDKEATNKLNAKRANEVATRDAAELHYRRAWSIRYPKGKLVFVWSLDNKGAVITFDHHSNYNETQASWTLEEIINNAEQVEMENASVENLTAGKSERFDDTAGTKLMREYITLQRLVNGNKYHVVWDAARGQFNTSLFGSNLVIPIGVGGFIRCVRTLRHRAAQIPGLETAKYRKSRKVKTARKLRKTS